MPKNVLVADDSLTMRKVISLVLTSDDFRLIEVDNGTDALAKTQEMGPDMVLADGLMPGKDGFELCAALKKNPRTAHIPVLLLLNGQEPVDEERVKAVGADAYLAKPFESQALLDKVCSLLKMPLFAPLPTRGFSMTSAAKQPVVGPSAPSAPSAPVAPSAPALPVAPVVSPPPAFSATPAAPPSAPVFTPPPSATTERSPAFLQPPPPAAPPRAASSTPLTPTPFSMPPPAAPPMRETAPRVASPVPPRGTTRTPGTPIFGAPPAPPPQPMASVAPVAPELQAMAVPMAGPSRPGLAPTFPPARTAPPAYGARPQPTYGAPGPRPLPLTQQLSRTASPATPAPPMQRAAFAKPPPAAPAAPLFSPAGRPTAYPSPGYHPPLSARAPMPQQATAGGLMRRDPFGLGGRAAAVSPTPSPAFNPEAVLRELLPSVSKELLEKVIWEVVPQLAETMIREHIERLIQAKEKGVSPG